MKRITAYLKGKVEAFKANSREKRVFNELEMSKINFEEKLADAEAKRGKLMAELATCDNVRKVLGEISEQFDNIEEAQRGLKRVEDVRRYFEEEVVAEENAKQ